MVKKDGHVSLSGNITVHEDITSDDQVGRPTSLLEFKAVSVFYFYFSFSYTPTQNSLKQQK